jgi:protocatechuate 3,4-dioxygenase beta subunit
MTGRPDLLGYDSLFNAYEDPKPRQELLSCDVVEREPHIQNNSCVLTPVVTEGPYYHKERHPIRQNIVEYQDGLMLASRLYTLIDTKCLTRPRSMVVTRSNYLQLLDIGVIDINTCKPLPNVLVDIWQANATGQYAGHPVPKPGLENEPPAAEGKRKGLRSPYPLTKPKETFLRGAWPTNDHGVAQFVCTSYPVLIIYPCGN